MQILNIAGYQFVALDDLDGLRAAFLAKARTLELKGTVLLSQEGINLSLAGTIQAITEWKAYLQADSRFAQMTFRESFSTTQPFKRLKIKLKKEIITMLQADVQPVRGRAPSVSPQEFKQWLDENRELTILDTRNQYEIEYGTFDRAMSLQLEDFSEFPQKSSSLAKDKPIVMFCTGGIRCEKAALHLLQNGFKNVYQLEGGILNYFATTGGEHYRGDCFVFDERIAVDTNLKAKIE